MEHDPLAAAHLRRRRKAEQILFAICFRHSTMQNGVFCDFAPVFKLRWRNFRHLRRVLLLGNIPGRSGVLRPDDEVERGGVPVQDGRDDRIDAAVDHLIVLEADVRLVGVYVDVDDGGRHVYKQDVEGILPLHQIPAVGVADGGGDGVVDDVPAVDEHALIGAVGLGEGGFAEVAVQADAVLDGVDAVTLLHGGAAVDGRHRLLFSPAERLQRQFAADIIAERDPRVAEDKAGDIARDLRLFPLIRAQEALAHGGVIEEVFDADLRSLPQRTGRNFTQRSARARELERFLRPARPRADAHAGDGGDAGDRLAAKSEGADIV